MAEQEHRRPGPCCECGKSYGKWFTHKGRVYCGAHWPYHGLTHVYNQEVSRKRRVEEFDDPLKRIVDGEVND